MIARTAGAKRTKTEIKRDYAYLAKLWNDIRTKTLESEAPSMIHEEGALVKKAIRDIYTNDIEEVIVEGDSAFKQAKAQMKMLIPSHAKKVTHYNDKPHLFQSYKIEEQLDSVYNTEVTLKSGGYLVINQTEALVAVDVNSGKATKERNIEETALKTNLEAAEEVGRQLKLRDLSGLIVIDFIDMEENRNQNAVERRLKDAVRNDRARIQVGSISHFGLLEMSRQRLRPSLVETVSMSCPHCEGTGRVRSIHSSALQMLRVIEQEAEMKHKNQGDKVLEIKMNSDIAIYLLNHKRSSISEIETLYQMSIIIEADSQLGALDYSINNRQKTAGQKQSQRGQQQQAQQNGGQNNRNQQAQKQASEDETPKAPTADNEEEKEDSGKRRRRGRRGGRRRKKRSNDGEAMSPEAQTATESQPASDNSPPQPEAEPHDGETKPKRRRSRGGRGQKSSDAAQTDASASSETSNAPDGTANEPVAEAQTAPKEKAQIAEAKPKKAAKKSAKKAKAKTDADSAAPKAKKAAKKKAAKKSAKKAAKKAVSTPVAEADVPAPSSPPAPNGAEIVEVGSADAPKVAKKGWWSR